MDTLSKAPQLRDRSDMQLFCSLLALAAVLVTVSACEGECIVDITNAFLGNYTVPIHEALSDIVGSLSNLFRAIEALT